MATKASEARLVQLTNLLGWYHHKYSDVRYCPNCHTALPKSENAPDYAIAPLFYWVECKNNDSTGRWNWKVDIGPDGNRKGQREWLQKNNGWIFIELGMGNAPNFKGAWLISWEAWLKVEDQLLKLEFSSLRFEPVGVPMNANYRPPATEILPAQYRLRWDKGNGWVMPKFHPFWDRLARQLEDLRDKIRSMQ